MNGNNCGGKKLVRGKTDCNKNKSQDRNRRCYIMITILSASLRIEITIPLLQVRTWRGLERADNLPQVTVFQEVNPRVLFCFFSDSRSNVFPLRHVSLQLCLTGKNQSKNLTTKQFLQRPRLHTLLPEGKKKLYPQLRIQLSWEKST